MNAKRILFVDDDPDDVELFCEALKSLHVDVDFSLASTGEDAFHQIEESPSFDLIFLDLNIPAMDGFETLRVLKRDLRYNNIPVVIFSTSKNLRDIERSKRLGANHYLTKPSSFPELCSSLKNIFSAVN